MASDKANKTDDLKKEHSLAYDICLSFKKERNYLLILNVMQSLALIIALMIILGGK